MKQKKPFQVNPYVLVIFANVCTYFIPPGVLEGGCVVVGFAALAVAVAIGY